MAETAGGVSPAFMPSGLQCALLASFGGGVHSADDAARLSALTGIPADKLQEAAYACGHGAGQLSPPEQAVQGAGSAAGGAASAVGSTFSGLGGALDAFGKGITSGPPLLLVAGGIILLALVLRK